MKKSKFENIIKKIIKEEFDNVVLNIPSIKSDKELTLSFVKHVLNPNNTKFDIKLDEMVAKHRFDNEYRYEGFKDFEFESQEVTIHVEGVVEVEGDDMEVFIKEMLFYKDAEEVYLGNIITPVVKEEIFEKLFEDDVIKSVQRIL